MLSNATLLANFLATTEKQNNEYHLKVLQKMMQHKFNDFIQSNYNAEIIKKIKKIHYVIFKIQSTKNLLKYYSISPLHNIWLNWTEISEPK